MNPYEKLREAVETALLDLESHGCDEDSYEYLNERFGDEDRDALPVQLHKKYKEALAVPRRNCDVGTEREQSKRFDEYCFNHRTYEYGCGNCPLLSSVCCELAWGQLPYKKGEIK